jgi:alkylation response protein AidB-like acyl-CoA dehydrogenase
MRPSEEELAAFRLRIRDVIATKAPGAGEREGHRAPTSAEQERSLRSWYATMYDEGLAGAGWPTECGGSAEHHPLHEVIVNEELIRARAPRPLDQVNLAAGLLLRFGTAEQQARYLPRIRSGDDVWCQLFSEPGAGSDLAGVTTRAEPQRDGTFILRGQKTWTTDGHWAQMGVALARTSTEERRHAGLSVFVVPMDAPGIEVRPLRTIGGAWDFNETFLDDVVVGPDAVLGGLGHGWSVVMTGLETERFGVAGNVALLRLLLEDLLEVADELELDGHRALGLADVEQAIADLAARAEADRAFTDGHVLSAMAGHEIEGDASIAKILHTETYQAISSYAEHLIGSGDLSATSLGARAAAGRLRDAWLWSRALTISGGSSEIMRNILAKRRLRLPTTR